MSEFRDLTGDEMPSLALRDTYVTAARESKDLYVMQIRHRETSTICLKCHVVGQLKRFGKQRQEIRDTPIHGKHVRLFIDRQRYKCRVCGATHFEFLEWLHGERRATRRLVAAIERDSGRMPNSHVAHKYGVDDKTVRNIMESWVRQRRQQLKFETPEWLGIDELKLGRRYRAVFTNIGESTLVEMLDDRLKPSIIRFLQTLDASRVKVVTIDMWPPYRDAVREVLPEATVTVDKFHVVRLANECLEKVRLGYRKGLTRRQRGKLRGDRKTLLQRRKHLTDAQVANIESWREQFPDLIIAYEFKERFYGVYDASTANEAQRRYARWLSSVQQRYGQTGGPWAPLISAMTNWAPEIMTYFESRLTNAFTESMNRIIRDVERAGNGYSPEGLRTKMIMRDDFMIKKGLASQSKQSKNAFFENIPRLMTLEEWQTTWGDVVFEDDRFKEVVYGVDLRKFAKFLGRWTAKYGRQGTGRP